ncbi:MAG TPA: HEAT repeat domain-containing protein [Thermoanaerobaculia bacterium]|nr:HEAT repeat domain-containing protein [Thermoanaerobaculia bacterium]
MIFYCPVCWQQMPTRDVACIRCGTDPEHFSDETAFMRELVRAVFHPEAVSARRAIWILGEKRCPDAVPAFARAVERADPYQLLAMIEALQKIGTDPAHELLERLANHESSIVAWEARGALGSLSRS